MTLSPVVLFVHKRLSHVRQTIEALKKNELASQSELFVYSDGAKNQSESGDIDEVREYIRSIDGFKSVTLIERQKNLGLSKSIISGVTEVVNRYGRVIVLEDDLVTSPYFLKFMNTALELYRDEPNIASIHGYVYPISDLPDFFFIKGADCWGWATWKDKWSMFESDAQKLLYKLKKEKKEEEANFNNSYDYIKMLEDCIKQKNDSWAVRWYMSAFLEDLLTLYPGVSYVQNIGFDNSGTHCGPSDRFEVKLNDVDISNNIDLAIQEDLESRRKFELFFHSLKPTVVQRVKSIIRKLFL